VAEKLHEAIPASVLTVLPGVGHQCNVEAARSFTAEVRAFLRRAAGP
jgi:pimeloyl-ACP methyl ester carboxylesterase